MNLSGCFMDLIAYTSYSLGNEVITSASYEQFRGDVVRLIEKSQTICNQFGYAENDYQDARFAVLVWVDECVMKSSWVGKTTWRKELLQRVYYKTTDGGVRFYKNLKELDGERNAVREVYYMCMVLGFYGRFGTSSEDQSERDNIKARCLNRITGNKEQFSDLQHMIPESYQGHVSEREKSAPGWGLSIGAWLTISLPVALFAFLIIIYGLVLNGEIASNFAEL